jgi:hypothetical protein
MRENEFIDWVDDEICNHPDISDLFYNFIQELLSLGYTYSELEDCLKDALKTTIRNKND